MNLHESTPSECSYSFLDFTLDLAAERLLRGTSAIKLRPKSFQVMRYLVERQGRLVTREELLRALWGDVAVTDESVTKCISDIRKALGDDSQEIIRTVPWRGFVFQPAVRRTGLQERPASGSGPRFPGRRTVLAGGLVGFAIVALLVWLQASGRLFPRRPSYSAIAVLPFENLSKDADQRYLADGMTDLLITNLGRASPLRVIARSSIGQYQGTKRSVREIARELNVDVLVEGTVIQFGDRLRVTANLIQVSPEKHLWANSYERSLRDVLALQNEIAGAIASEIHGKLALRPQPLPASLRPANPEAHLAYWKARYFLHARRDVEAARKSLEYSEQAARLDPNYARAQAALAWSYHTLSSLGGARPSEVSPRAKTAALRAIALDEELAEAHAALGVILFSHDWDWAGAERAVRRAIALNPSDVDARLVWANHLAAFGRVDEAVAEIRRTREMDPLSLVINRDVGRILYYARRYDEALAELGQSRDMQPNSPVVVWWIAKSRLQKGLADDAFAADLRTRELDGLKAESLEALRTAYSGQGLPGYWAKLRQLLLDSGGKHSYDLAEISAYLNDKDEVFRWLEKAYEYRASSMPFIGVDPSLDAFRSDPRFSALLRRMGLPPLKSFRR